MRITFSRVVLAAAVLTIFASFYSLDVAHRISSLHAGQEKGIAFERDAGQRSETGRSSTPTSQPRKAETEPSEVVVGAHACCQWLSGGLEIVTLHAGRAAASHVAAAATGTTAEDSTNPAGAASSGGGGSTGAKKCYTYEHTELWGDVVMWGSTHKVDSAGECCDSCRAFKPANPDDYECNVWVYCGDKALCGADYRACWLKHLAHPSAAKPAKQDLGVQWTSGTIDVDISAVPQIDGKKELRKYHIVTSAQGTAVHWQVRIHYYWYKKQKHQCEQDGPCEMGGFTRLLHSGQADDLMDEIPTVVVDPLPSSMVEHSWYVVLNRPYAFVQWVEKANIPEKYVLMAEPDHVYIRPLPNFMTSESPAAFPFFYIEPGKPDFQKLTAKFTDPNIKKRQIDEVAPIGNSPTFMRLDDMKKTMGLWMNTSIAIFKDPEASKAWGWVQEMYGFAFALWRAGIRKVDLYLHMMAQPPWDQNMQMAPGKPFYIIHYTYGMDYKLTGEFTPGKYGEWRYDKRSYTGRPMPRKLGDPPAAMKNDLVRALINSFNEATAAIPCWDEYARTGKVVTDCGEKPGGFLALEAELKAKGTAIGVAAAEKGKQR